MDTFDVDFAELSLCFSDRSPQPLIAVEGKTHIIRYVNKAFEKLAGKNESELFGHRFEDAIPEGQENKCVPLLDRVFTTGNPEVLLDQKHSEIDPPVYWSYFVWPMLGIPNKKPIGLMVQITDSTESMKDKKKSVEANQQLLLSSVKQHELSEQFELTAKELQFKTEELEGIIGIVSHDLRAPLVNVKGFGNELKKDYQNLAGLLSQIDVPPNISKQLRFIFEKSVPQSVDLILSSADSMDNLVKRLIEVARLGLAEIIPEKIDMNEIMRRVLANLKIKLKHAGAKVKTENLPGCWADRDHVAGIFTNLVDNSVKYLDPNRQGEIRISGKEENGRVVYCVEDNGVGIAIEDQSRIFDLFTRLVQTAHEGGEGMGLSIIKRMIDRNNGQIWIESEKGKGSKFYVALPCPPVKQY